MDNRENATRRTGESGQIPNRSDRYFQQEGYWYFRTREGLDIGPCDTIECAMKGVAGFIGFLQEAEQAVVTNITKYVKMQARKDEHDLDIPQRTHRIFQQGDYWYFRTREGMDIGPFDARGDASLGIKGFVQFLEESQPEKVKKVTHYIRAI